MALLIVEFSVRKPKFPYLHNSSSQHFTSDTDWRRQKEELTDERMDGRTDERASRDENIG